MSFIEEGPIFAEMLPQRFNNKTDSVIPRRWLLVPNPAVARPVTAAIGDGWIGDPSQIARLKSLAGDSQFRSEFRNAKREAKLPLIDWLVS
jgi:glycogen phosphorylase